MKTSFRKIKEAIYTIIGLLSFNLLSASTFISDQVSYGQQAAIANFGLAEPEKKASIMKLTSGGLKTDSAGPMHIKERRLFAHSLTPIAISHVLSLSLLFASSKEKTKWEHDFGKELFQYVGVNLKKAWTELPVWDKDVFKVNYIQHPYAGAFYYNLMRSNNATCRASFAISVFGSTFFEYVTEAMFEHPSIQDLLVTPVVGSLLGEGFHRLTLKMTRNGFTFYEKIIVLLINPAYVWNHGFKTPQHWKIKGWMK